MQELSSIGLQFKSEYSLSINDQYLYTNAYSIPFKPKDDPDAPPTLQLQQGFSDLQEEVTVQQIQSSNISIFEQGTTRRERTCSEDSVYSILGFMQRKLKQSQKLYRNRKNSEQISTKSKYTSLL